MAPGLESEPEETRSPARSVRQLQDTPSIFFGPSPRAPRSQAQLAVIRVQNRRREYLERNPTYFASTEHEFADPLLYDELVRRFQTPAEREAEGQKKGYGRVLEGSLLRGEARLAQLAPSSSTSESVDGLSTISTHPSPPHTAAVIPPREVTAVEADNIAVATPPSTKAEANERWEEFLRNRFIRGGDEDFEYAKVDENEDYDTLQRKDEEEAWFEDEDPNWASSAEVEGGDERVEEKMLQGETGVQDF